MKRKMSLTFLFFFILFLYVQTPVSADGAAKDFGKKMGKYSLDWLYIGASYVVLRRTYVYSRKYLSNERAGDLKPKIKEIYQKCRSPLLLLHNIVMILATIVGIIHGVFLGKHTKPIGIVGWLAVSLMTILSVSGYLIWQKFKPVWNYRKSRTQIRWLHKQWLFSILLIIFLFLHLNVFDD